MCSSIARLLDFFLSKTPWHRLEPKRGGWILDCLEALFLLLYSGELGSIASENLYD
jgi:hypothetical protein